MDTVISYLMSEKEKIHPTFIKNDRQVVMYMHNVGVDDFRPFLKINIKERCKEKASTSTKPPPAQPQSLIHDNSLKENWVDDRGIRWR